MSAPAVPVLPRQQPPPGAGRFSALLDEDLWSWSEELVALLGHTEHPTLVTTELFLHHVLPADRHAVGTLLEEATERPCSATARARTTRGHDLVLRITAGPRPRPPGSPRWLSTGIEGSVVPSEEPRSALVGAAGARPVEHARAVVMHAFGLGTDAALALLGHYARVRRLTLEDLARDVVRACEPVATTLVTRALVAAALSGQTPQAPAGAGTRTPPPRQPGTS